VIGVGGGGSSAVSADGAGGHHRRRIHGGQHRRPALKVNPAPVKIQIGGKLTKGLGAGADRNVGRQAALETPTG
jgi:cell division protein FtsZ